MLANYSKTLTLLEQYDRNKLKAGRGKPSKFILSYENCLDIIIQVRKELALKKQAGQLFGNEINQKFESLVKNLYQTFSGKQFYKYLIHDKI
ncbi:MAG: hypothetical protein U9Q96_01150 [Patescibacteria group bacterium]|nr:hypothetical protein [Patescibacteria group bacterium]